MQILADFHVPCQKFRKKSKCIWSSKNDFFVGDNAKNNVLEIIQQETRGLITIRFSYFDRKAVDYHVRGSFDKVRNEHIILLNYHRLRPSVFSC